MQALPANYRNGTSFYISLLVLTIAFLQTAVGFYAVYDYDMMPPASSAVLGYFLIFWIIGDWFLKDSKRHNVELPFDIGISLHVYRLVFIPYYLLISRGFKRTIFILSGFLGLYIGIGLLSYFAFFHLLP